MVDGQRQMNPYIMVNPESRMPEVVYARCLCVGYSPTGTLNATDVMIRLDLNIYLLETIQSTMEKLKDGANRVGVYGPKDDPPKDANGKPQSGRWNWMPIHSVGGIGMWVNMAAPEFADLIKGHTTRLKFIERLAQSFAERNALKAHPAIPKNIKVQHGVSVVTINGWVADFDRNILEELRQLVENDQLDKFEDPHGRVIDVEAVEVDASAEELETVESEVTDAAAAERKERKGDEEDDDGEQEGDEDVGDLLPKAGELFTSLMQMKGRPAAKKLLAGCEVDNLEEASPEQLQSFIDKANETLNPEQ
jgi:hypothetical protein